MTPRLIFPGGAPQFLTAPTYILGRGADCDVLLPAADDLVSRHHARLECDAQGQWWLSDTSSNGTFVNGEPGGARRALYHGDQIGVGRSQIAFDAPHLLAPPVAVAAPLAASVSPSAPVVFQPAITAPSVPLPAPPTEEISIAEVPRAAMIPAPPTEEVAIVEVSAPPFIAPPLRSTTPAISPKTSLPDNAATPPTFEAPQRETFAPRQQNPIAPPPEFVKPAPPTELELPVVPSPVLAPIAPPMDLEKPLAEPARRVEPAPPTDLETPVIAQSLLQLPQQTPAATQKQCTRCRALYSFAEEQCPQCGAAGFKVKAATLMAPAAVTPPQARAALESVAPQAQVPAVTPFDSQIKTSPIPLTALAGAALVGILVAGVLPWIQISLPILGSESLNYFQCWQLLQNSGFGRNNDGSALGLMLLMPPLTFLALGAALLASLDHKMSQVAARLMLAGGAVGVLAMSGLFLYLKSKTASAWGLSFDPSSLLGAGFWGFGLLSVAAAGVGLWALVARNNAR